MEFNKYMLNGFMVQAVEITMANLTDLVWYICENGGGATGHLGDTASKRPARIRIKQRNYGENWGKYDWRVAKLGDYIVIHNFRAGTYGREFESMEFSRVKKADFERDAKPLFKEKVIPLYDSMGGSSLATVKVTETEDGFVGEFKLTANLGEAIYNNFDLVGLTIQILPGFPMPKLKEAVIKPGTGKKVEIRK